MYWQNVPFHKERKLPGQIPDNPVGSNSPRYACILCLSLRNWKSHTETFSLRGAQFTAASVGAVLAAATGMGLPAAINAGAAMISFLIGIGYSSIPSDVYFKGKRCVSKSTGKIYYRYKGSIYKDSSHTQAMVKNLSWSRRWGH